MHSQKNYTGQRILNSIGILVFLLSALVFADKYKVGATFQDCPECPEMVVVPKGKFLMGSPKMKHGLTKLNGHNIRLIFLNLLQ